MIFGLTSTKILRTENISGRFAIPEGEQDGVL